MATTVDCLARLCSAVPRRLHRRIGDRSYALRCSSIHGVRWAHRFPTDRALGCIRSDHRFASTSALSYCMVFSLVACRTTLVLVRIAMALCCMTLFVCVLLIVYDILVLTDPTRCFMLSCSDANVVVAVNTTSSITVTGWPLTVPWPDGFRSAMNTKRFIQGAQLFCVCFLILTCSLYLATCCICSHATRQPPPVRDTSEKATISSRAMYVLPQNAPRSSVSIHDINERFSSTVEDELSVVAYQLARRPNVPSRVPSKSASDNRICRRCMARPRAMITSEAGRCDLFSHTCTRCRDELLNAPTSTEC